MMTFSEIRKKRIMQKKKRWVLTALPGPVGIQVGRVETGSYRTQLDSTRLTWVVSQVGVDLVTLNRGKHGAKYLIVHDK